jgi:4-amino-4-deoxy-L-arabinose transferase-like glycosyltransferase
MSVYPNLYDEGIILTGAMRVMAGQVPHRDFYANYGPAQFYMLATLFKIFGPSLLLERIFDIFLKALLVVVIYLLLSRYARRWIVLTTCGAIVFWLFGLFDSSFGVAIIPVALLNVVAIMLIASAFHPHASKGRMIAAGAIGGLATLFRYDTGFALVAVSACVIASAICPALPGALPRLRMFVLIFGAYLLGFAIVILPSVSYYLAVAPMHPLVHDIILYPSKYYHAGRNVPFPPITLRQFDNAVIYSIILLIGVALWISLPKLFRVDKRAQSVFWNQSGAPNVYGFLFAFGVLGLAMYAKGLVRVQLIHLFLALIPAVLILAVALEHRHSLPRYLRLAIVSFASLFAVSSVWSTLREIKNVRLVHGSLPEAFRSSATKRSSQLHVQWCDQKTPLTQGLCFLPDDDHIRAIEFISTHTTAQQSLFVGLSHHDRIYSNDDLIYFATQRLPATHWSHFDPGLQNRSDIQAEMVHELESNAPPYIVRDAEFDLIREPNDSSKSTGVTILDRYLDAQYQWVCTFGELSIWRRTGYIS